MSTVTSIAQLNAAIIAADGVTSPGTVTITLANDISLGGNALKAINLHDGVALVGGGGAGLGGGLDVTFADNKVAGGSAATGYAQPQSGAGGGGGVPGAGGFGAADARISYGVPVNNGGDGVSGTAGSMLTGGDGGYGVCGVAGVGAKARFPSLLARNVSMSQVSYAGGAVPQLVFIDRGVEDHHTLLTGLAGGARALVLDPSREALVQILEVLETCGPVEAIHIVAHGSPGELHFMSGALSHKNIPEHASALARIGCALQAGGDILLYGCDVGRGEAGRSFIEKLAEITGADVAAATHPVGARGGSFDLDLRIGTIATVTPFAPRSLAAFSGLLNGGDGGGVRAFTYGGAGGTGNTGQQGADGGYAVSGGGGGGGASGTTTGGGGGAGGSIGDNGGAGGSGGSGAGAAGSNGANGTTSSSDANGGGGGGGGGGVAGNGNTGLLGGSSTGGAGGDGGRGGDGLQTAGGGGGGGGAGGDGAVVTSSTLNAFALLGGAGGDSGDGGIARGQAAQHEINGYGGNGGSGGIGLRVVGSGLSVTNTGSITGGSGGYGGGFGGDGLVGASLDVVNSGTISGGVGVGRANAITFTGGTNSISFNHGGTSGLVGNISVTGSVNLLSLAASTLIDNSVTGSGSVSKGGSNLITLSGNNSYSGGTSLNSGTLGVGGFSALGSGTLGMANGTTLQAAAMVTLSNAITITGTATIDANGNDTILNGAVTGIGTLNVTNSGGAAANVTLDNTANAFTLGSVSLAGGDFTLVDSGNGGTLTVGGPVSATNINLTTGNNLSIAGTLTASGLTLNAAGVTTLGVSLTGIGSLETDAAGTTALNGGSVTTTTKQIYNDAVTLGRNATLTDTGSGIAFTSTVNGSFSLTTNVNWVTVFNGAVGGTTALTSLSTHGGLETQINGGSVRTTGAQSYHDYVVLGATTTLTSTGSGAITFDDGVENGGFDLHVITAGAGTFDGGIFGTGRFIQEGTGTTTILAVNTYTGATTVNAGTLLVDGSITSSITSVNNGGTLGGHGTTGAVSVANGGSLSPGAGAGLLTTGNLSLSSGAHFRVEIGGAAAGSSYDQVHVNGTVSLGGATLNASVINGFVPASGSFKILDNDGNDQVTGTFAGLAEGSSFFAGGVGYAISYHGGDGNDVVLTVDVPPVVTGTVTLAATAEDSGARLITQAELLSNATDADSPSLTATSLAIATGSGTLVNNNNGTWSYTPAHNDDTQVSFSYHVTDGASSVADSATLDITPVNDAPVVTGVVALTAIAEDSGARLITQAHLLANVTDVDGPSLTAAGLAIATGSGTLVDNHDGTWSYSPALNDDTAVSFSYSVTDGVAAPVADSATLDMRPVNDAPFVTGAVTLAAITEDSGARLITQAQLLGNATDVDGPPLTAANLAIATGSGALVDNHDGTWSYTPALNDDHSVSFSYSVTDGTLSVAGSATLNITPVNDAPVVAGAVTFAAIAEDSGARLITQAQLLGNVTDVDGPSLTAVGFAIATGSGSLVNNNNGTWNYTPGLNDDTSVAFSWRVTDGTTSVADSGTLDITPVNDAPVNTMPASQSIVPNSNVAVTGLAVADVDSTALTTTLHVEHGTLVVGAVGGAAVAGSGSSTVTLTGSAAQIDAVLGTANNVLYHSVFDFSGTDHLTMTSHDGALSDIDVLNLSVFQQVQAQTFGDITRPTITLDATGHIILDQPAIEFASAYGMKGLYLGLPSSTPFPPVVAPDFHL